MLRIKTLLVMSLLFACNVAHAEPPELDLKKTFIIDGPIMGKALEPFGAALLALSKLPLKENEKREANIIINSPGGSVISGFLFINQMEEAKANGLNIRCFVPTIAASMAFHIFVHCNERYALNKALLLWHRARVSVGGFGSKPMTAPQAQVLANDLQAVDSIILEECEDALGMDSDDVKYHFENETLHVGSNLHKLAPHFVTSYESIPNLLLALLIKAIPHSSSVEAGDLFSGRTEIIYQSDKVPDNITYGNN